LKTILLLLLLASPARAAWPYDSVGELFNGTAGGSATLVGVQSGRGLCISCFHIFEDGINAPYIRFGATKYRCRVLALDKDADLSALEISAPPGITTPRCVRAAKASDGNLVAVGYPFYGTGDAPHWTSGKFLRYSGSVVEFDAHPFLHSGFSGGALFAADGSYVGTTNGYGTDYSYAESGPVLEKFAGRWLKVGAQ
jgi:S1-C subfamily serine protease